MGVPLLSVPFRLNPSGTIATVDSDSEQADAEQLGVLIATKQGERELAPGFGMPDMTGRGFNTAALVAGVAAYGPAVTVEKVDIVNRGDGTQDVAVSFS